MGAVQFSGVANYPAIRFGKLIKVEPTTPDSYFAINDAAGSIPWRDMAYYDQANKNELWTVYGTGPKDQQKVSDAFHSAMRATKAEGLSGSQRVREAQRRACDALSSEIPSTNCFTAEQISAHPKLAFDREDLGHHPIWLAKYFMMK